MATQTKRQTSKAQADTEGTDTPAEKAAKASMPSYQAEKFSPDDLPEDLAPEAGGGRKYLYFNLMKNGPMQDPGEWYRIAYFYTPNGAKDVAKELVPGEDGETKRPIPDGVWEISGRTINNPEDPGGAKHSALFVRYMGEE